MRHSAVNRFWATVVLAACAACSPRGAPIDTDAISTSAHQYSATDKAAARALSIGNRSGLADSSGPYDHALLCILAIQTISDRYRDSGALDPSMKAAMQGVSAIFEQRARQAAPSGSEAGDLDRRLRELDLKYPDETSRARMALGCARELQRGRTP